MAVALAARAWMRVALAAAAIALLAWGLWSMRGRAGIDTPSQSRASAAEIRQQELLKRNIDGPGDPDLVARYETINVRHFGGMLPSLAVRWEPALADVGPLAARTFTLEGMFGRIGRRMIILMNPAVKGDPRALDRALCHEMVHLYLFTVGDETTNHGPAFQAVLHRLSAEGAFEGIAGTDEEKAALRAWIEAESARLDADKHDVDLIGDDIARERAALEAAVAALNARIAAAAHAGGSPPSADDIQTVDDRRQRFNRLVIETNARIARGRAALAHFNDEVARYNLMLVYPDGLDEATPLPPRAATR